MKPLNSILLLLCLLLSTACSLTPVRTVKTVAVLPPESMTAAVAEPVYAGNTNEDHLHYTLELRGWGRECYADLEALREWRANEEGQE